MLEEERAHAPALVRVADGQRELGRPRVGFSGDVSAHADELLILAVAADGDQAHVPDEVQLREVAQIRGREVLLHGQEAEANRVGPQAPEMREQAVLVVRPDGADAHGSAVAQEDVARVGVKLHRGLPAQDGARRPRSMPGAGTQHHPTE